jgi:octopine/nopaline transport system substrate-binding protein
LQAKQFDIIISGMSITADRKKEINFSTGYAELANKVVVAKDSDLAGITEIPALLAALMAIRLACRLLYHAHFMEKLAPTATLKSYATLDEMQIDLANGRVDVGFADVSALQSLLNRRRRRFPVRRCQHHLHL